MSNNQNLNEPWEGHIGEEIESFIKRQLARIKDVDNALNSSSSNAISNAAVAVALGEFETYVRQQLARIKDTDNALNSSSSNPISNSAVTAAINDIETSLTGVINEIDTSIRQQLARIKDTDNALDSTSNNPISNAAVAAAIDDVETALTTALGDLETLVRQQFARIKDTDNALDSTSNNPISNAAVATAIGEVEAYVRQQLARIRETDESLDSTSTNPISNAAVTRELNAISDKTLDSFDVSENDDNETITLVALNKNNQQIAAAVLPKGGGGDTSISKPRVTASVSRLQVKLGEKVYLTYTYDHVDGEGVRDGVKATLEVTIARGSTQTYHSVTENVDAGASRTIDITDYLLAGSMDIYVKASCVTMDGQAQSKQAFTNVYVVTLNLSSSFDISASLTSGGYTDEIVSIPYTIVGTGTKIVTLYVDGVQTSSETISRSGTTNGAFTLDMSGLSPGGHNIQMVADREGILSESIYFDILKAGSNVPFIGIKTVFSDGRIYEDPLTPTFEVEQYGEMELEYVVWTPNAVVSAMSVSVDNVVKQTVSVNRQIQTYTEKFDSYGTFEVDFISGVTTYPFYVDVSESSIDIGETTTNLQLKLSAAGRSNDEEDPADWGGITSFKDCDFETSGWTGSTLKLINGAMAEIDFHPFETDVTANGLTLEFEFMVSNVIDKGANVITCFDQGKGIEITTDEAHFYTGSVKRQETAEEDEHGDTIYREVPVGVAMKFASDLWLKVAFVIHKRSDHNLVELYINGVRSKADVYGDGDIFIHSKGITISSAGADVQIRNMRIYNRAISDDEELSNYIIDRPNSTDMLNIYNNNDVMGENDEVSMDAIRRRGKGVVVFVRANGLDDINAANDKKKDFLAEKVYWYSPYGLEHDFVAENIYVRIQGTSSTKYPRKNYRLYLAKGESPKLYVNGSEVANHKYGMRPDSIPMNLFCLKADFSDSSMTMNTGGAKLFDSVMRGLDLETPPQEYDSGVRQSIDGIPCDVFCATEDGGETTYYGQYNFNNEKSKSGRLFGMEGVTGFTPACPIALETLNNSNPGCLFQAPKTDLDDWLNDNFDDGFEFNYPEDVFWTQENATKGKGTVVTAAQKTAIRRLMAWIADVTPANIDYDDISTFISQRFKSEIGSYFNVDHLLTYYIITDYWASVDQRAKNILWRTWDGLKWYATFYDGDTAMGVRNDSFLVYLYNITRDSWDADANKYAFEGHDSNLWCLVLANLEEELKAACDRLRGLLTNDRMLSMFNGEQMGNWCERVYNKSGEFKYITPQIYGVPVDGYAEPVKYSYMYALTGNREAHRTYFLRERGLLLDARYGTSSYQSDNIDMYASRSSSDPTDTINLKSGDIYYYGYRTNNGGWYNPPIKAENGENVELTFTETFAINDPIRVCGASKMKELDMSGMSGHIIRGLGLNKCKILRKFVLNTDTTNSANSNWYIEWSGCTQLEYIDLTGQTSVTTTDGGTEIALTNHNKLKTLLLGDTHVTSVTLTKGSPLTTLVLPDTITNLVLRGLPNLTDSGLTLQGCRNVARLWISNCPGIDWQALLAQCTNVLYVRIEGLRGAISLSVLQQYKTLNGIDSNGNIVDKCRFEGTVMLDGTYDEEELADLRTYYPELTIKNAQYSHYWYDDTETNPANVTNEDNKTGYAYGSTYVANGHVVKIKNKCQMVSGYIHPRTHKMHVEKLNRDNLSLKADGSVFDPNDANNSGYDVFVYIPHYWYKGINDHKNSHKHIFISSEDECPVTFGQVKKTSISELVYIEGYGVDSRMMDNDVNVEDLLSENSSHMICKVSVKGMRQVRFPSVANSFFGHAFTNDDGDVLLFEQLTTDSTGSPSDFNATWGDYDFRDVPFGATWLYFTCVKSISRDIEAIVTDSSDLEAIEPDWVEHKSELIGVYRGSVGGYATGGSIPTSGLRSIGNSNLLRSESNNYSPSDAWTFDENGDPTGLPSKAILWAYIDYASLARVRNLGVVNGKYGIMSYETNKCLINLIMLCYGSRKVANAGTNGFSKWNNTDASRGFGDFYDSSYGPDYWGLKRFLGGGIEMLDYFCMNAPSWERMWKEKNTSSYSVDYVYNVRMMDGSERRLPAVSEVSGKPCVMRVRFGRYCDTVASSIVNYTGTSSSYAIGYCAKCAISGDRGAVFSRQRHQSSAYMNLAMLEAQYPFSGYRATNYSICRLTFWGEIENEEDLL